MVSARPGGLLRTRAVSGQEGRAGSLLSASGPGTRRPPSGARPAPQGRGGSQVPEVWFQNRRAKWRKKENTKKGPGRPAHNSHPTTCSGEPMDPEEIARKELEKMEKKKRKHEKKLLKSQGRHLHSPGGLSLHSAPSSDSDSGGGGLSPEPPEPPPPAAKGPGAHASGAVGTAPAPPGEPPAPGTCDPAFYPSQRSGAGPQPRPGRPADKDAASCGPGAAVAAAERGAAGCPRPARSAWRASCPTRRRAGKPLPTPPPPPPRAGLRARAAVRAADPDRQRPLPPLPHHAAARLPGAAGSAQGRRGIGAGAQGRAARARRAARATGPGQLRGLLGARRRPDSAFARRSPDAVASPGAPAPAPFRDLASAAATEGGGGDCADAGTAGPAPRRPCSRPGPARGLPARRGAGHLWGSRAWSGGRTQPAGGRGAGHGLRPRRPGDARSRPAAARSGSDSRNESGDRL
uniref:Homeobox domain-containing protein n=1 Tax=Macaca fascicularis TaxID=9541 RepID=A0A7N9DGH0_MACFA